MSNVDGTTKKNGKADCGGLIRDYSGIWIGEFSKNIDLCSSLVAELRGVL